MGAILGTVLRVLAGMGIGEIVDKVLPDKVETPFKGDVSRMPKLLKYAAVVAIGAIIFGFIAKKFKLKF